MSVGGAFSAETAFVSCVFCEVGLGERNKPRLQRSLPQARGGLPLGVVVAGQPRVGDEQRRAAPTAALTSSSTDSGMRWYHVSISAGFAGAGDFGGVCAGGRARTCRGGKGDRSRRIPRWGRWRGRGIVVAVVED